MKYNLIVWALIPMIFVGMIPFSFAEDNTEQCKKVYRAEGLSLLERFAVYRICLDLIDENTIIFPKKVSRTYKVVKDFLEHCDDFYPIFLQVNLNEFHAIAKRGATGCVALYKTESYHESGPDRISKIYFDVQSVLKNYLEETKEQRQKALRESRIHQGKIMNVQDIFDEQQDKIYFLEKQIIEKNKKISENDIIIKDQLNVINSLNGKIKNTALTLDDYTSNIPASVLEECFREIDAKDISTIDKINELQQCSLVDYHIPITVSFETINAISNRAVEFCIDNYDLYLAVGNREFSNAAAFPMATRCLLLYEDPIWNYEGPDRFQVLVDFAKPKVAKLLHDTITSRQQSVYEANIKKGHVNAMVYVFILQEEKITLLEKQLAETNEQITKQEALMLEQLKTIQELFTLTKTNFSHF